MFDRKAYQKEYQRKRAEKVYNNFKERRVALFIKLGNECYLCTKPAKKGYNLHHFIYETESNYPKDCESMATRLKRLEEAETYPERFRLLCSPCHSLITRLARTHNLKKLTELIESEQKQM